jgi:hypothetical protein
MLRECYPLHRDSAERLQRSTDQREAYPGCARFARDPGLWLFNAFSVEEAPDAMPMALRGHASAANSAARARTQPKVASTVFQIP